MADRELAGRGADRGVRSARGRVDAWTKGEGDALGVGGDGGQGLPCDVLPVSHASSDGGGSRGVHVRVRGGRRRLKERHGERARITAGEVTS